MPGNLVGHGGPVKAIRVDASGDVLTGSFDYAMMLWVMENGAPKLSRRRDEHGGAVNAVAFGGGKYAIAAGDDLKISLWNRGSGNHHKLEGHKAKIAGLAVSPDGLTAASASWDRTARIWDLDKLQAGPVLEGHTGPVNAVAFSSDGRRVFTASADGAIRAFDAATGALERPIYKHEFGINVLERLPGGDHLVFGSLNGDARIIDGTSGAVIRELPAHSRPVLALAVLEKPGLIATGGGDGVIRVLRAGDGALVEEYRNPSGPVWALAFKPDASALYWGGLDDFVSLWTFNPREPFEPVDSRFPRRFQASGAPGSPFGRGELQFARKCSVCHTLTPDGANRAGPSLYRVFGRRIATLPGYPFSEPLRGLDIVWSAETIDRLFELGPDVFTPGSKMPLQQMANAEERAALIEYLKVASDPAR